MKVMNTTQILDEVLSHQLNFGLVEAPIHHPDVHTEAILSDELSSLCHADHPLADVEVVTLEGAAEVSVCSS